MAIKEQVQVLLNKKMDRREFVKQVAIGLVAMTGASSALKTLAPKQDSSATLGYGASAYGGGIDSKKLG